MDSSPSNRRQFFARAAAASAALLTAQRALAEDTIQLPFANGERKLVQFPQKRPLILLTHRPPQLETPFSVFNDGIITPNDAFFVRYHLSGIPLTINTDTFRLEIKGLVEKPITLSLDELRNGFENVEVIAVNQCSCLLYTSPSPRDV
jgi:sulfite dehydrogenase